MSKRKRSNEINVNEEFNVDTFLDSLNDNYPFIYISLQAGKYVLDNPLILKDGNITNFILAYKNYINNIMSIFYSGKGFYYDRTYVTDQEDYFEISIATNIPGGYFSINFGFLTSCIEIMVNKLILQHNIGDIKHEIRSEGGYFYFCLHKTEYSSYWSVEDQLNFMNDSYNKFDDGDIEEENKIFI